MNYLSFFTKDTDSNKKTTPVDNEEIKLLKSLIFVFFNNIALVHNSIGKHSLSSLYFKQALIENAKFVTKYSLSMEANDSKGNDKKSTNNESEIVGNYFSTQLMNRRYEILFNMGLSLLFSKQPVS